MKNKVLAILLAFVLLSVSNLFADEGMWLPMLISRFNIADMQKMGCKLTADQIYSVNQACIKDAIVALDHGGCSGSIISGKGLLITNHHCGYEAIAGQSTVDHDYLTDGYWAMRPEEELPIPGKTVSFLVRMEDVTSTVLSGVNETMKEEDRNKIIEHAIDSLTKEVEGNTQLEASVESMFAGNEYYLFVYQTYRDIRLVGAPASGIGKFGGETDNWMWPRHTGDFCILRVYSGADGNPSEYSKENIPYHGKYFLPISMAGVKEGDFSIIMGYPGSTDRYLTSYGIQEKINLTNPADILLKTAKMDIIKSFMDKSDALRISYASDYAYLANFQKKSIQETKALTRLKVFDDKKKQEDAFEAWARQNQDRADKYGTVISEFADIYKTKEEDKSDVAETYLQEMLMGAKVLLFAYKANELASVLEEKGDFSATVADYRQRAEEFYKDYNPEVDKQILEKMMELYKKNLPEQYYPETFKLVDRKFKGDFGKYADYLYKKSILASKEKFNSFLDHPRAKKLQKDPAFMASNSFLASYILVRVIQMGYEDRFNIARRKYIAGLKEMDPGMKYYPDANSTLRLTYGQVKPYEAADAVSFDYRTTYKGILEKDDPSNPEFTVPKKLENLLASKDFGDYAENGVLPVCFLTTHDITGGNSGSPVLNANGELIGLAFDGNSESMSSDIKYDENLQRTICVDIRYVLFVIDKFAGAGYLLNEMKLQK
ncbi:MAG: S46 family peptidase [Bacteroidetes bacterium]|nr:S46 family peptidase [Bacteroidota bacterium]